MADSYPTIEDSVTGIHRISVVENEDNSLRQVPGNDQCCCALCDCLPNPVEKLLSVVTGTLQSITFFNSLECECFTGTFVPLSAPPLPTYNPDLLFIECFPAGKDPVTGETSLWRPFVPTIDCPDLEVTPLYEGPIYLWGSDTENILIDRCTTPACGGGPAKDIVVYSCIRTSVLIWALFTDKFCNVPWGYAAEGGFINKLYLQAPSIIDNVCQGFARVTLFRQRSDLVCVSGGDPLQPTVSVTAFNHRLFTGNGGTDVRASAVISVQP